MKTRIISFGILAMMASAVVAQTQYDAARFGVGERIVSKQ